MVLRGTKEPTTSMLPPITTRKPAFFPGLRPAMGSKPFPSINATRYQGHDRVWVRRTGQDGRANRSGKVVQGKQLGDKAEPSTITDKSRPLFPGISGLRQFALRRLVQNGTAPRVNHPALTVKDARKQNVKVFPEVQGPNSYSAG